MPAQSTNGRAFLQLNGRGEGTWGEYIFLKRSEADRFLEYIREEFRAQDMRSARADLEEDISSVPKRGLFGTVRRVSNNRYKVMMSMSW